MTMQRKMELAWHVEHMGEEFIRNFGGKKPERERPMGRPDVNGRVVLMRCAWLMGKIFGEMLENNIETGHGPYFPYLF
jgi:hypothetical protein